MAGVLPSVVQISTSEGSGSGVVYDAKGDIVTNAHVVGTATSLRSAWRNRLTAPGDIRPLGRGQGR